MGTESADLLVREYKLVKASLAAGDSPQAAQFKVPAQTPECGLAQSA